MTVLPYSFTLVEGAQHNSYRAIGFLESTVENLDARTTFANLPIDKQREVRGRFDHWLDGQHFKKYHHGWDKHPNKKCYVFKWIQKQKYHRIYCFLCHPRPDSSPGFRLCVLVSHAIKSQWETDPAELAGARRLMDTPGVVAAIRILFPEFSGEKQ